MGKERAHLSLEDDDFLDVSGFQPVRKVSHSNVDIDIKTIEKVAEKSGFVSRKHKSQRRKKPQSPYRNQLNLKCRDDMKELFQDAGERLGVHDHTTFEQALLSLLEKHGYDDLLQRYKDITK